MAFNILLEFWGSHSYWVEDGRIRFVKRGAQACKLREISLAVLAMPSVPHQKSPWSGAGSMGGGCRGVWVVSDGAVWPFTHSSLLFTYLCLDRPYGSGLRVQIHNITRREEGD